MRQKLFHWTPSARNSLLPPACAALALLLCAASATPARAGQARARTINDLLGNPSDPAYMKVEGKPAKKLFGHMKTPAPLPPQPIGSYARGCAAGNVAMPLTGPAWQVMRLSRNRFWGQPILIKYLERYAREARKYDGWPGLLIGDLSQPRGGPMLSGHASHQIGLDVDIWFDPMPDHVMTRKERETKGASSVTLDRKRINPKRFGVKLARILRRAALYPETQRIFVHPPIKKYLCDWSRRNGEINRAWLARIRPYYGHADHFHIRLRCPRGAANCKNQGDPRPKDGTGCGAHLAYWYSNKPWGGGKRVKVRRFWHGIPLPRPRPRKPRPKRQITLKNLPPLCKTVLLAR